MVNIVTKAFRNPKKAIRVVRYKGASVIGDNRYRKFIVLTRSRTGSNLLVSLLNSHPNISADGEIFSKLNGRDYKRIISNAFSRQPRYIKAKGFKIFYYHPQDDPTSKIWDFLRAQDDLYIIHLTRENILETITSRKIADYTDIWSSQSPKKQNPEKPLQVRFTKEEAEEKFIQTREWEKKGEEWFNHHNVLHITYEDLTQYRSETFGKVADFLGVARQDVSTSLKKQRKKALSDTIEGYKELKQSFINTEWEEFFVD